MGLLEHWDRRNQRIVDYQNARHQGRFRPIPETKAEVAVGVALGVVGAVCFRLTRSLVEGTAALVLYAIGGACLVVLFAFGVRQHRRNRRKYDEEHSERPPGD